MRMPKGFLLRATLVCTLVGMALGVVASGFGASAASSEQVVFSKSGASSPSLGQFGFWIWCEADSTNPYQGECNGSMYFFAFGITKHVIDGSITELAEDQYEIHVLSARDNGASIDCTLTNTTVPPVSGPHNTIDVSCTHPSGTATVKGAVVKVTGP